ncbi:MAG: hypothetical protein RSB67_02070, partial [Clostridia bacterium]
LTDYERNILNQHDIPFLIGDGNSDGVVDDKDYQRADRISKLASIENDIERVVLDVDRDGKITATDASTIGQIAAGIDYSRFIAAYIKAKPVK